MAKSDVEPRRAVASVTAIMSVEDNFVNIDAKNNKTISKTIFFLRSRLRLPILIFQVQELTPLLNFYSQADPYKLRHVDDYSLKLNYARTTKFKNSYFNRIVEMWNSLPLEIRLAPNLEAFKSNVKKFLI